MSSTNHLGAAVECVFTQCLRLRARQEHSFNERRRGEASLASKTLGFNSQLKPVVDIAIRGIASINED